jgi:hypothetical protein
MPEVPRIQTPFQEASIAELLRLELLLQRLDPHRDMAALMLAQIALETARGSSCQNFNVGNITALESSGVAFYRPPWFDDVSTPRYAHLHAAMLRGAAPRAFRSFNDFSTGVAGYVFAAKHLGVVEGARTGDAEETARVIRTGGYAPDAGAGTGANLNRLRDDYIARGLFDTLPLDRAAPTPRDPGLAS